MTELFWDGLSESEPLEQEDLFSLRIFIGLPGGGTIIPLHSLVRLVVSASTQGPASSCEWMC